MSRLFTFFFLTVLVFTLSLASCKRADDSDESKTKTTIKEPEEQKSFVNEEDLQTREDKSDIYIGRKTDFPSFSELVEAQQPSVVNISTTSVVRRRGLFPDSQRSPFGDNDPFEEFFKRFFGGESPQKEFRRQGLGSGFIISGDGYVVTNNHVVDRAEDIQVILEDGKKFKAEIIGKDPKTDIAVLKIEPDRKLKAVKFGNSDNLRIGDWVMAIGNPFGLGYTVTAGIVSAKGRSLGLGAYDDFIQTDAPLNLGNSGGPLFNLNGEVVGINTAIAARGQGIGFSIPSNLASNIISQLKNGGEVVRGWLGVVIQSITPEIAESINLKDTNGALIADVSQDSPAYKAGLQSGDVVIKFNGNPIEEFSDLTKMVAVEKPGSVVIVTILREGVEREIKVVLGELKDQKAESEVRDSSDKFGFSVEEITPELVRKFKLDQDEGVMVVNVARGTRAWEAGFRLGDVILKIDKMDIRGIDDYDNAIEKFKDGGLALFLVKRVKNTLYIGYRLSEEEKK